MTADGNASSVMPKDGRPKKILYIWTISGVPRNTQTYTRASGLSTGIF